MLIYQGPIGPQNVQMLGPQGPKILKLWGPGGKMGGPILTWHLSYGTQFSELYSSEKANITPLAKGKPKRFEKGHARGGDSSQKGGEA